MVRLNQNLLKGAFTMGTKIGQQLVQHSDPRALTYAGQTMAATPIPNCNVAFNLIPMDTLTNFPKNMATAFIQSQTEKEQRAQDAFGPVVNEIKRKSVELINSPEQLLDMKEQLKTIKNEHKETQQQLKNAEESLSYMTKGIDHELKQLLKQKIDPKTVDVFCKVLKTSSKVATSTIPALRVFSHLSSAYEAAKALYPNETAQLEQYMVQQLQHQWDRAQEIMTTPTSEPSFKNRLLSIKQDSPSTEAHHSNNTPMTKPPTSN